jgi:L-idonate 5-dehydrogenase
VAENVLRDGREVGFEHPGAYAEYFVTEAANVYPLPVDFPLTTAILSEPLAVAVRGLRRAGLLSESEQAVIIPKRALIFGDGPLGLLLLLLLQHVGVGKVCLVGGVPERLRLARELGAEQVYSYQQAGDDLPGGVRRACDNDFPLVIEASGAERAMTAALQLCGKGARVLVIGDYDDARADFSWNSLLHRELTLIGSNAGGGAWPLAVKLLVEGNLPLARLVTHRFPPERFAEALELVRGRKDGIIKAAITW